jgi:hypothetical protein
MLRLDYQPDKLEPRADGSYSNTRVHMYGTLSIEVSPAVVASDESSHIVVEHSSCRHLRGSSKLFFLLLIGLTSEHHIA